MLDKKEFKAKLLASLIMSNQLSKAQLTVGPLRHMAKADRDGLLDGCVRGGLVSVESVKNLGPVKAIYRLTDKGRRLVEKAA